jgi:hypothetical protein
MRRSILILVCCCAVFGLTSHAAAEIINAVITVQGRLTDLDGNPVADGSHQVIMTFESQDGATFTVNGAILETSNGFFTKVLSTIPQWLFECATNAPQCAQTLVVTPDGGAAFPDIIIGNAGRASVAARVNGDVETSPSRIDSREHADLHHQRRDPRIRNSEYGCLQHAQHRADD